MSIVNIKNSILTKLQAMGTLKTAFNFASTNPNGNYPYATLTLRRGSGSFRATTYNERVQGFWIRIFQEQAKIGQGIQAAESIATAVLDEIQVAFDMDTTLSGNCKWVEVVNWDATIIDREHDMRILELEVNAHEIVVSK